MAQSSTNSIISEGKPAVPDRDFNYVASDPSEQAIAKGGVSCPFPWRLHEMLKVAEEKGLETIVSWCSNGKAFIVHKPKIFAENLMKRFFCQTKYASFQRQLNLYGFQRIASGSEKGAYYNTHFVRGERAMVRLMTRRKIKGNTNAFHSWESITDESFATATEQPMSGDDASRQGSLRRKVSCEDSHHHNLHGDKSCAAAPELAFFEGVPFQPIEVTSPLVEEHATTMLARSWQIDPAVELANLRAYIQQKRAEYEQVTRRRADRDSLSSQKDPLMADLDIVEYEFDQGEENIDHDHDECNDQNDIIVEQYSEDGLDDSTHHNTLHDNNQEGDATLAPAEKDTTNEQDSIPVPKGAFPPFVHIPVFKGSYISV